MKKAIFALCLSFMFLGTGCVGDDDYSDTEQTVKPPKSQEEAPSGKDPSKEVPKDKDKVVPSYEAGAACGDLGETGICNGKVLAYCDAKTNKVVVENCSVNCLTDENDRYAYCQVPCGEIDTKGMCDGTVLSYCNKNNSLVKLDCKDNTDQNKRSCGLDTKEKLYSCVGSSEKPSGKYVAGEACGEVTEKGLCHEGKVVSCGSDGKLVISECKDGCVVARDLAVCKVSCGEIDSKGVCDGTKLSFCESETLLSLDCKDNKDGKTSCGYLGKMGYGCYDSTERLEEGGSCSGIDTKGACNEDNVLLICGEESGVLGVKDCTVYGGQCVNASDNAKAFCKYEKCSEEKAMTCSEDGLSVSGCVKGELLKQDCSKLTVDGKSKGVCEKTDVGDRCVEQCEGGIDSIGQCSADGKVVRYCERGKIVELDCSKAGKKCVDERKNPKFGYYVCG